MSTLIFTMTYMPIFMVALAAVGITIGLRHNKQLKAQRALADQRRFLRMGYLRKVGRQ